MLAQGKESVNCMIKAVDTRGKMSAQPGFLKIIKKAPCLR